MHGSNLVIHPSHGLQRGVVVAQLELAARHVLHLVDGHTGVFVVLSEEKKAGYCHYV